MKRLNLLVISFFNHLKANSFDQLTEVVRSIRKATTTDSHPPIDELLSTGIIPYLLNLLDYEINPHGELLSECAWIISNVADSAISCHVEYIVQLNAAQKALNLLNHVSLNVKDSALWILLNITGSSLIRRDMLLDMEIVPKLVDLFNDFHQPNYT